MLIETLSSVKHSAQIALQLAKLVRCIAQHAPTEHDGAVVLFQVAEVSDRSDVPATNPHPAFYLNSDLQIRPCEIESPAALGVEAVFAFRRGQAELVRDG